MQKANPSTALETKPAGAAVAQTTAPATPAAPVAAAAPVTPIEPALTAKPASTPKPARKPAAKVAAKAPVKAAEEMSVKAATAKAPTKAPAKAQAKAPAKAPAAPTPVAAKPGKTAAKAAPAAVAKPAKAIKQKLVRDSFTFPEAEYLTLVALKKRLLAAGTEVKKGELMRAGLALLSTLATPALASAVGRVEKLKTGRPSK